METLKRQTKTQRQTQRIHSDYIIYVSERTISNMVANTEQDNSKINSYKIIYHLNIYLSKFQIKKNTILNATKLQLQLEYLVR